MAHASTLLVREAARARPGSPVLEPRRSRGSLLIGRGKRPSLFWPVPRALFGRCACALFPTRSVPDQDGRARATFAAPLTCAEPSLQPLPGGRRPDGAAGGGPGPVGSVQEARPGSAAAGAPRHQPRPDPGARGGHEGQRGDRAGVHQPEPPQLGAPGPGQEGAGLGHRVAAPGLLAQVESSSDSAPCRSIC
ncbi:large ribosomal subunit protein uL18m isoform X2 [Macrotis lagotis]|uniref:large ribosomal subunit protein uL18m isoform X2 n=1 Tax=Macrotis lagotis TaxID=92651 RepID=UPI003D6810C0